MNPGPITAAGLVLLAAVSAALIPVLPGSIRLADEGRACQDPGQLGATIFDATDHIHPWSEVSPVCPLGFSEMFATVRKREGDSETLRGDRQCIRNERWAQCGDGEST